jgi:hypothetical protein
MSINGIRGPYGGLQPAGTPAPSRPPSGATTGTGQARPTAVPVPASPTKPAAAAAPQAVPVQPPTGTDPELWSVLTQDERSYFAKLGAMGPLTYGRILSGQLQPTTPHVVGGRLDVKA